MGLEGRCLCGNAVFEQSYMYCGGTVRLIFLGSLYKQYQAIFTQSDKNKSQKIGYSTDVSVMEERHLYNTCILKIKGE